MLTQESFNTPEFSFFLKLLHKYKYLMRTLLTGILCETEGQVSKSLPDYAYHFASPVK